MGIRLQDLVRWVLGPCSPFCCPKMPKRNDDKKKPAAIGDVRVEALRFKVSLAYVAPLLLLLAIVVALLPSTVAVDIVVMITTPRTLATTSNPGPFSSKHPNTPISHLFPKTMVEYICIYGSFPK